MPIGNIRVALPPLAAGAFGYYANSDQTTDLDPMMLENVEALAIDDDPIEGGGLPHVICNCGLMWGTGCKADNYGSFCGGGNAGHQCSSQMNNCSN